MEWEVMEDIVIEEDIGDELIDKYELFCVFAKYLSQFINRDQSTYPLMNLKINIAILIFIAR